MVMGGPFKVEHWSDIKTELTTLYANSKAWEDVRRTPDMRVLPSTWAFKCKHCPDGKDTKFKACFAVCGDCQVKGIDYFQT